MQILWGWGNCVGDIMGTARIPPESAFDLLKLTMLKICIFFQLLLGKKKCTIYIWCGRNCCQIVSTSLKQLHSMNMQRGNNNYNNYKLLIIINNCALQMESPANYPKQITLDSFVHKEHYRKWRRVQRSQRETLFYPIDFNGKCLNLCLALPHKSWDIKVLNKIVPFLKWPVKYITVLCFFSATEFRHF